MRDFKIHFVSMLLVFSNLIFGIDHDKVPKKLTFKDLQFLSLNPDKAKFKLIFQEFLKASAPQRLIGLAGHEGAKRFLLSTIERIDNKKSGTLEEYLFPPDIAQGKNFYQNDFKNLVEKKIPQSDPEYRKWKNFTDYMLMRLEKTKTIQGHNIVWSKKGKSEKEVLVLTAHYDSIAHDKNNFRVLEDGILPGADYNASGVILALMILQNLALVDLQYSVEVVFLDYHSYAMLGSLEHSKNLLEKYPSSKGYKILGVLNLEMLGHDSLQGDSTQRLGNMKVYLSGPSSSTEEREMRLWDRLKSSMRKANMGVDFTPLQNQFAGSDHVRYWERGIAAMTFSQDWENDFNPHYQTPQDTFENINFDTLYSSYRALSTAILAHVLKMD